MMPKSSGCRIPGRIFYNMGGLGCQYLESICVGLQGQLQAAFKGREE